METALKQLQTILGRRNLDTTLTRVTEAELDDVNIYTIGKRLVIFSQKLKIIASDATKYLKYAADNGYTSGTIIVTLSDPSENVLYVMKTHAKNNVQFFTVEELQVDITLHTTYYMPHRICTQDEVAKLLEKKKIVNLEQLPKIDSQDIQVRLIGAIPGDVINVTRHSETTGRADMWRLCVTDVSANVEGKQ